MNKYWQGFVFVSAVLLSLFVALPAAQAHGGGAISVQPAVAAAGSEIQLTGSELEAGSELVITLSGLSYQAELGTVTVSSEESFQETFKLPADTKPGVYQIQATSEDGDTYTTEITVEAAGASTDESVHAAEPSAEPMQLDRSRSGLEWGVILAALVISGGVGLALIR